MNVPSPLLTLNTYRGQGLFIFRKVSPLPLGEGQDEGVSTQTDLPQLLPLQGELSLTSALSPRERENEKALYRGNVGSTQVNLPNSICLLRPSRDIIKGWMVELRGDFCGSPLLFCPV